MFALKKRLERELVNGPFSACGGYGMYATIFVGSRHDLHHDMIRRYTLESAGSAQLTCNHVQLELVMSSNGGASEDKTSSIYV